MRRRMAYNRITEWLREMAAAQAEAQARQMPLDEGSGERLERRKTALRERAAAREAAAHAESTRREFLEKTGEGCGVWRGPSAGIICHHPAHRGWGARGWRACVLRITCGTTGAIPCR
jgi:hypothetical protein